MITLTQYNQCPKRSGWNLLCPIQKSALFNIPKAESKQNHCGRQIKYQTENIMQ